MSKVHCTKKKFKMNFVYVRISRPDMKVCVQMKASVNLLQRTPVSAV